MIVCKYWQKMSYSAFKKILRTLLIWRSRTKCGRLEKCEGPQKICVNLKGSWKLLLISTPENYLYAYLSHLKITGKRLDKASLHDMFYFVFIFFKTEIGSDKLSEVVEWQMRQGGDLQVLWNQHIRIWFLAQRVTQHEPMWWNYQAKWVWNHTNNILMPHFAENPTLGWLVPEIQAVEGFSKQ